MSVHKTPVETAEPRIPVLLRRAVLEKPIRYTPAVFLARMGYHLFIYGLLLVSAILLVMFIYRPVETGIICIVLISFYVLAFELIAGTSSSSARLSRIHALGITASYILAASFLWKELTDGALLRIIERSVIFSG
jgi:hypothetical protein